MKAWPMSGIPLVIQQFANKTIYLFFYLLLKNDILVFDQFMPRTMSLLLSGLLIIISANYSIHSKTPFLEIRQDKQCNRS